MARTSKLKAARKKAPKKAKPARPKKAKPPALTPLEAARITERFGDRPEVQAWLARTPVRKDLP